ncbi:hypothetical protein OG478_00585 [Streptomyces phaeochromogenes]|uniref:hypothetical protein n=1 Tax=Streptomyces phaeochromogenes TaxID=1923 RepID=UPI00386ECF0F|nr:hypothetical protein OG478_00585 [Streptomyces phaeochromogenes]
MIPLGNESLGSCDFVNPRGAHPRGSVWTAPTRDGIDSFLLRPDPPHPFNYSLDPSDQRRLALHAALTAAGVPPTPEDRPVIDYLSALPADVNDVLLRWLHHTL